MQKEELKFENSTILEGMTSISSLIEAKELKINDRKIYRIYYDVERKEKLDRKISYLRRKSVEMGFEIILVSNSRKNRVDTFAQAFDIPYVKFSLKPLKRGIKKAIKTKTKKNACNIFPMYEQNTILPLIWEK